MSPKDMWPYEFKKMVVMGESTVQGGGWLVRKEYRWADILADLMNRCQENPVTYHNKGISANAISPRSPGYEASAKPSALERYRDDVIALKPDLFILCYGLNDMRAGMNPEEFREDMQTIIGDVKESCNPVTVLTTVYHMTAYKSWSPFDKGGIQQTEVYNEVIRQLAEDNGCILADVWAAEGKADWLIHPDGVHANMVGNIMIANRVFETIAQNCSGLTLRTFKEDADTGWTRDTMKARKEAGDPFEKAW